MTAPSLGKTTVDDDWLMPWWELLLGVGLLAALLALQYQLWLAPNQGWRELWQVEAEIRHQIQLNEEQQQHNQVLWAEIHSLQVGTTAIEERGRQDLVLVASDETFFQIIEQAEAEEAMDFPPPLPIGPQKPR